MESCLRELKAVVLSLDKYKQLVSNTIIFTIGTFSSKFLVFLLMPLYTRVLSTADYGVVDLVTQTCSLLIPFVSLGVTNSIVRFGLDKHYRKSDVFTTGFLTIFAGFLIFLFFVPLLAKIEFISNYILLICAYVLMSCLRSLCSQFIRSKQYVRLYAFDGILSTVTSILFNIVFLLVFKWGITGYILSTVCSDFLSAIFLFCIGKLWHYIRIPRLNTRISKAMLKYCIPLIPTTIFWWITNVSDRYMVAYMLGESANGLYAISYKIPTMIILISSVFIEAWQLSAVTNNDSPGKGAFFSRVLSAYQSIVFVTASGLIMTAKLITTILVSPDFYASWEYIPILVLATSFSCFVTFLGSIYMVEKKSIMTLLTTIAGALINIGLNFWLIPIWGPNGAAVATFVSYFAVYVIRTIDARRYIRMNMGIPKMLLNLLLLIGQAVLMIKEVPYWLVFQILLFILIVLINFKSLMASVKKILHREKR